MLNPQTLNIPLKLMKCCRKNKTLWELFTFAVCIKMLRGSSAIYPSVTSVRKIMGCSYYKATRLIEGAKRCTMLFRYYPEANLLIARSFTHGKLKKEVRTVLHTVRTSYSAFCLKFRYKSSDCVSHIEVSRSLRDKLLVHAVKAVELKNDLQTVGSKKHASTRSNHSTPLHSERLGKISGYHRCTAMRHLHKLEQQKEIVITSKPYIPVADFRTGHLLTTDPALLKRKAFLRSGMWVVRDVNDYATNAANQDRFVNVIFNHARRHVRNNFASAKKGETVTDRLTRFFNHEWTV